MSKNKGAVHTNIIKNMKLDRMMAITGIGLASIVGVSSCNQQEKIEEKGIRFTQEEREYISNYIKNVKELYEFEKFLLQIGGYKTSDGTIHLKFDVPPYNERN